MLKIGNNNNTNIWFHLQGTAGLDGLNGHKGSKGDRGLQGQKGDPVRVYCRYLQSK